MDDVVRSRRLFLIALGLAACAGGSRAKPVGVSAGTDLAAPVAPDAGPKARVLSFVPSDFRAHFSPVSRVAVSAHAMGRFAGEVYALKLGARPDAGDVAAFVDGDVIVEALAEPNAKATLLYVMKRESGGWRFYAEDDRSVVLDEATSAPTALACARCHAEAPRDGVFVAR